MSKRTLKINLEYSKIDHLSDEAAENIRLAKGILRWTAMAVI